MRVLSLVTIAAACLAGASAHMGGPGSLSPVSRRSPVRRSARYNGGKLACRPRDHKMMAIAIPGNSIPEQVFVGGSLSFLQIYNYLITGRILLSWFPQAQGVAALQPLFVVTDPFLNLFRGLGLNFAGLDFSVLPAFLLLSATTNAVASLGADLPPQLHHPVPPGMVAKPQPVRKIRSIGGVMLGW